MFRVLSDLSLDEHQKLKVTFPPKRITCNSEYKTRIRITTAQHLTKLLYMSKNNLASHLELPITRS